jgi:hypothetical protein
VLALASTGRYLGSLLVACLLSRCPSGERRAGKLRARHLRGRLAAVSDGADGDRAAPGAACLADTPPPDGRSLHVLDMLGSRHSYDLRMHCNLLTIGPVLTRHDSECS